MKEALIADFRQFDDPAEADRFKVATPFWKVDCDFVLSPVDRSTASADTTS